MREFEIAKPILYGHSEGATIAFLYASEGKPVKAIIAESPIVIGEKSALATVEAMDASDSRNELIEKLRRYHKDPEAVFSSWVEGVRRYLAREFPSESYLTRVACPVLAIQGAKDPFGGAAQARALASRNRRSGIGGTAGRRTPAAPRATGGSHRIRGRIHLNAFGSSGIK